MFFDGCYFAEWDINSLKLVYGLRVVKPQIIPSFLRTLCEANTNGLGYAQKHEAIKFPSSRSSVELVGNRDDTVPHHWTVSVLHSCWRVWRGFREEHQLQGQKPPRMQLRSFDSLLGPCDSCLRACQGRSFHCCPGSLRTGWPKALRQKVQE